MTDEPAWWDDAARLRHQNRRSAAQERAIAREVGGKVQAGSGSSQRAPQDVKAAEDLISVKYTDKRSFTLVASDLIKLQRDALRHGREPAMILDFEQYGVRVRITIE